jgi:hypothetical protein
MNNVSLAGLNSNLIYIRELKETYHQLYQEQVIRETDILNQIEKLNKKPKNETA